MDFLTLYAFQNPIVIRPPLYLYVNLIATLEIHFDNFVKEETKSESKQGPFYEIDASLFIWSIDRDGI